MFNRNNNLKYALFSGQNFIYSHQGTRLRMRHTSKLMCVYVCILPYCIIEQFSDIFKGMYTSFCMYKCFVFLKL